MAISETEQQFVIDQEAAEKILSTPAYKFKKSTVPNDLHLSEEERFALGRKIISEYNACK